MRPSSYDPWRPLARWRGDLHLAMQEHKSKQRLDNLERELAGLEIDLSSALTNWGREDLSRQITLAREARTKAGAERFLWLARNVVEGKFGLKGRPSLVKPHKLISSECGNGFVVQDVATGVIILPSGTIYYDVLVGHPPSEPMPKIKDADLVEWLKNLISTHLNGYTITNTEILREAKAAGLNATRDQILFGIEQVVSENLLPPRSRGRPRVENRH